MKFTGVFDQNDPVRGLRDFGEQGVREGCLACGCAARDQDVVALGHGLAKGRGLSGRHDPGGDVVFEGEDRDRRFADRERRGRDDRRKKSFETLSRFRQLGGDARRAGMDFGADMVGD